MQSSVRIGAIAAMCGFVIALYAAASAGWAIWLGRHGHLGPQRMRSSAMGGLAVAAVAGLIAPIAAVLEYHRKKIKVN